MPEDGRKWSWWLTLGAPLLVTVLGGWILGASEALPGWITGLFTAIPPLVRWSLLWSISLAVAFGAGQTVERSRSVRNRDTEAQIETEPVAETEPEMEPVTEPKPVTELEPPAEVESVREPEWVTEEEAGGLVHGSNYWSRIKRQQALDKLDAEIEYEVFGIEIEPEPGVVEREAIVPPRHTPDVDAVLQNFWDDHPTGREGGLYHLDTLREWLEEQAYEVELPST